MITNDSWPPLDQPIIQPSCRVSSGSAIIRNSDQGPIPYSRGSTLIRIKVFHLSTRSSRGLGHRPFTAVTRVQIPYESPLLLKGQSEASSLQARSLRQPGPLHSWKPQ